MPQTAYPYSTGAAANRKPHKVYSERREASKAKRNFDTAGVRQKCATDNCQQQGGITRLPRNKKAAATGPGGARGRCRAALWEEAGGGAFVLNDDHPMVAEDLAKWAGKTYTVRRKY